MESKMILRFSKMLKMKILEAVAEFDWSMIERSMRKLEYNFFYNTSSKHVENISSFINFKKL